jgi:hypothetical protein
LLPEIQFAFNVSVDTESSPGVSPFQLVFGRRPRLSGKDVTFPQKVTPSHPVTKDNREYVTGLCKRLQQFRLAAIEKQMHRKQTQRDKHDKTRPAPTRITPTRGDVVYLHVPTSTPKVKFQWTDPTWLVLAAETQTVTLKPLVSASGRARKQPPLKVANMKKMHVAGPRPADFWVGAVVRRKFNKTWFLGKVVDITTDEGKTYYQVQYEDCDQEDLDAGELWDSVIYHPRLDTAKYMPQELPALHDMIMFSMNQQPRIAQVTAIDLTEQRPITVRLWKPSSKVTSLASARYTCNTDSEAEELIQIKPEQVCLAQLKFSESGFLDKDSQRRVNRLLRPRKPSRKTTPRPSSRKLQSKMQIPAPRKVSPISRRSIRNTSHRRQKRVSRKTRPDTPNHRYRLRPR